MACLKCGKKTQDEQVFCSACLAVMEAYPVKPTIHIQLPNRKERTFSKRAGRKHRALSPEEQLALLKKRQRRLLSLVALLLFLLGAIAFQHLYPMIFSNKGEKAPSFSTQISPK